MVGRRQGSTGDRYSNESGGRYGDRYEQSFSRSSYGSETHASGKARKRVTHGSHPADPSSGLAGSSPKGQRAASYQDMLMSEDDVMNGQAQVASAYSRDNYTAKRSGGPSRALIVAIAVVAVIAVGAIAAFAYMGSLSSAMQKNVDDDLRDALVATDMGGKPFYMLLLGTDRSTERDEDVQYGGSYRSDSMVLMRVDPVNRKVTLISICRDILADIPGYGRYKINTAYGLGGPALAVQAVSALAGVDISHYAEVDFDAFSAMVDALGGIEVDVPIDIDDYEAGGSLSAGLQTLDGEDALILCRSRESYANIAAKPDLMRTANQRLVLTAIAKKLLDADILTIANTAQALAPYVTTDMNLTDIVGLAQIMQGIDPDADIYSAATPTESEYIEDTWYEILDQVAWSEMMSRVEEGLPPTESALIDEATGTVLATAGNGAEDTSEKYASVMVKNGTNRNGLAAATSKVLAKAGFKNVVIGDIIEGYSYPQTLIIYEGQYREREAEQIRSVLGQGALYLNDGTYLIEEGYDFLVLIGDDWIGSGSVSDSEEKDATGAAGTAGATGAAGGQSTSAFSGQ